MPAEARQWKATEKIKTYPVSGSSGHELSASIGKNGPKIGNRRTIAVTNYDLKWGRKYRPQGNDCKLASARPFLTIIYSVPKPTGKLSGNTARSWKAFSKGVLVHEKVHGTFLREMVDQIIDQTVGLTIPGDRKCRKIRTEVLNRVKQAVRDYRTKSRNFDAAETSANGNIRKLVKNLLRGG